ncbi:MAG TPA: FAD-binding oxidoreductase, partial [Allosphingosinicella sp.]|nr:FAD-binding oxidoreductase [Allosphingosinicella sp.]
MADVAQPNRTYWNETADVPAFPRLSGDLDVDVAVIGGGIVGVTTARLLKDQGLKVAVIEARRVGRQVTGKSTAKMTSQHGLLYQTLESKFGEDKARLYAEAQEAGIGRILQLAAQYGIDADIEPMPAFVWTDDESWVSKLEKEVELARRLGLPASFVRGDIGLPFAVLAAMLWDDQAQFHPVKYVAGLAATIPGDGSHVFEETPAIDVRDASPCVVDTAHGPLTADRVLLCTHQPFLLKGFYYARMHLKRSYALGVRLAGP